MENQRQPNILYTVNNQVCTGCGVCQGACPAKAISSIVVNGEFRPQVDFDKCNNSKGCHRCIDSCPGVGINLIEYAQNLFDVAGAHKDKFIGFYRNCYVGYSNDYDLRYHSASGGSLSQFLIWLLENDKIDGAVVSKFDKSEPMKVKTIIAKTREDIVSAKGSKYAPTTLGNVLSELKNEKGSRFVVVGVPCQIEGLRKLMSLDKKLSSKVCGLFSVFCSGSRSFYFTEYVMKERNIDLEKIDYLAYRDNGCLGGLVVKGNGVDFYEDYQSYCHPLRSFFIPRRCVLCADHFGELSDVSFGDIHIEPYKNDRIGVNSIVTRNSVWDDLLIQAKRSGALSLGTLNPETLLNSQVMAKVKKKRNIVFCKILKAIGRKAPEYGTDYGVRVNIKSLLDFLQMRFQQFVGQHKKLWWIISLLKAKVSIS